MPPFSNFVISNAAIHESREEAHKTKADRRQAAKLAHLDHQERGQYLGTVEAPNEKAAEAAAVAEFDLSDEQRRRLVVQERTSPPSAGRSRSRAVRITGLSRAIADG